MSILNLLQQAQGGKGVSALADQLGLDAGKAGELTELLAPMIGSAAKKRAESGGLGQILDTLRGEEQGGLFDDATAAASEDGQANGGAFLEQLLGNANAKDDVAREAAERTGIDLDTVTKFLPALAAMAQGGLQKNLPDMAIDQMLPSTGGGGLLGTLTGLLGGKKTQGGGDTSLLTGLLDADGDGSAMDDILKKFL